MTVEGLSPDIKVVLLPAAVTICLVEAGVPERKFASPEYVAVTDDPGDAIALEKLATQEAVAGLFVILRLTVQRVVPP